MQMDPDKKTIIPAGLCKTNSKINVWFGFSMQGIKSIKNSAIHYTYQQYYHFHERIWLTLCWNVKQKLNKTSDNN